jgi:hypothetical protein
MCLLIALKNRLKKIVASSKIRRYEDNNQFKFQLMHIKISLCIGYSNAYNMYYMNI